jgi:hypothetical protein
LHCTNLLKALVKKRGCVKVFGWGRRCGEGLFLKMLARGNVRFYACREKSKGNLLDRGKRLYSI